MNKEERALMVAIADALVAILDLDANNPTIRRVKRDLCLTAGAVFKLPEMQK